MSKTSLLALIAILGFVCVGEVTRPVAAQDYASLNDAQRRRLHLPFIRAATDCVSNQVLLLPNGTELLQPGKEFNVIASAIQPCLGAITIMVNEHDKLYGPGTGLPFYKGPYFNDLPRAVLARIRSQLERIRDSRVAEAARQEAERKQRVETAERTRDLLRDRMYECTTRELATLVRSAETAEVLASASMTICNSQVSQTITAQIELMRANGLSAEYAEIRDKIRQSVIATAVQAKAAALSAPAQPVMPNQGATAASDRSAESQKKETSDPVLECLKTTGGLQRGKLVEASKLAQAMVELCRPEIEASARKAFLDNPSLTLDKAREASVDSAVQAAKRIVGPE